MNYKIDPPAEVTSGPAPHPGGFIRRSVIEPFGVPISRVVELIKVNRPSFHAVLEGRQALTADVAYRLEALTGVDADLLLAMQARHERDRNHEKREAYAREITRLKIPKAGAAKPKRKAPPAGAAEGAE